MNTRQDLNALVRLDVSETGSSVQWDASSWANLISDGTGYAVLQQEVALPGGVERHLLFEVKSGPMQVAVKTGRRNAAKNVCQDGSSSASSYYSDYHRPEKAFDGTDTSTETEERATSWAPSTFSVGQTWLQYIFPSKKLIDKITIEQSTDGWCSSLIVQKYDGGWVKLKQFDNIVQGRAELQLDAPVSMGQFRIVFNSRVYGVQTERPWVTIVKAYDVSWTYDETPVLAEASYFTGSHDVTFTPDKDCTAYLIFRHNSDAARAIDAVSLPTAADAAAS